MLDQAQVIRKTSSGMANLISTLRCELCRPPRSRQEFFDGASVMGAGSGNFLAIVEMMDAMRSSRKHPLSFITSIVWTTWLVIPHTTAVYLAYGQETLINSCKLQNLYA